VTPVTGRAPLPLPLPPPAGTAAHNRIQFRCHHAPPRPARAPAGPSCVRTCAVGRRPPAPRPPAPSERPPSALRAPSERPRAPPSAPRAPSERRAGAPSPSPEGAGRGPPRTQPDPSWPSPRLARAAARLRGPRLCAYVCGRAPPPRAPERPPSALRAPSGRPVALARRGRPRASAHTTGSFLALTTPGEGHRAPAGPRLCAYVCGRRPPAGRAAAAVAEVRAPRGPGGRPAALAEGAACGHPRTRP
jgi:hypothetical protein